MSGVNVLEAVVEILERWGWVQHAAVAAGGFDIVGAFEESTGVPLRNLAADEDAVISAFVEPSCDAALRALAHLIGPDPVDGPIPDERWAWVHVITQFNDRSGQAWPVVRRKLHEARDLVARAERDGRPPTSPTKSQPPPLP